MSRCDFAFICDKRWFDLTPTDRDDARHCGDCDQPVFRVDGDVEMNVARLLRRCAAVVPDDLTQVFVGYPIVHHEPLVPGLISTGVRLVEAVADARVADLRRSLRALFDDGVNEATLLAGDLVVLGNLEQDAVRVLADEFYQHAPELLVTGTDTISSVDVDLVLGRTMRFIDPLDQDDSTP